MWASGWCVRNVSGRCFQRFRNGPCTASAGAPRLPGTRSRPGIRATTFVRGRRHDWQEESRSRRGYQAGCRFCRAALGSAERTGKSVGYSLAGPCPDLVRWAHQARRDPSPPCVSRRAGKRLHARGLSAAEVSGKHRDEVLAFVRSGGRDAAIVVAARLVGRASNHGRRWPSGEAWEGSLAVEGFSSLRNIFTAQTIEGRSELHLSELLDVMPVSVLQGRRTVTD
jgi:hypothetical protein